MNVRGDRGSWFLALSAFVVAGLALALVFEQPVIVGIFEQPSTPASCASGTVIAGVNESAAGVLSFHCVGLGYADLVNLPFNASNGLVAYWSLNEGGATNTVILDYSGFHHSGTRTGTTSSQGKFGYGTDFIAANQDYIHFGSNYPNMTGSFTVSFWFKGTSFNFGHPICHGGENQLAGWCIYYNSNTGAWQTTVSDGSTTTTTNGCAENNDGAWHFFAEVFTSGSSSASYLDNSLCQSVSTTVTNTANSQEFVLGRGLNNQYWNGGADDFRVYDYALSATQRGQLYNWVPGV